MPTKPFTYWLTGLSGAGKATLANAVALHLRALGQAACVLDGDALRSGLCRDLGFSAADREENMRRTAELAQLLNRQGITVIAALISPTAAGRAAARQTNGSAQFIQIYVNKPLAICQPSLSLPGAWGGAASAPFAGQCPLSDRGATRADGIARLSFIDSCSRLFHGGYRPQWHIKTGVATTPLSAGALWSSRWPARRCCGAPVAARLTLQDALHCIRLCKRCNSRRVTVVCTLFPLFPGAGNATRAKPSPGPCCRLPPASCKPRYFSNPLVFIFFTR